MVVLLATTGSSFAIEENDGLCYILDTKNKTATVTKGYYIGKIIVPDKITANDGNEYLAVDVGRAFSECAYITGRGIVATSKDGFVSLSGPV